MADVVNLRRVRKAKARAEAQTTAELHRAAFGRTKAEREVNEAERDCADRHLDSHRLSGDDTDPSAR